MKKFYYLRDEKSRPIITVCIIKGTKLPKLQHRDLIARGVAICSVKNPKKKIGRDIAEGRAEKAWETESCDDIINRRRAMDVLYSVIDTSDHDYAFLFKSEIYPYLSDFEKEILDKPENA